MLFHSGHADGLSSWGYISLLLKPYIAAKSKARCLQPDGYLELHVFVLRLRGAMKASRSTVVDLQSGDPACKEAWTLLCDISRQEFQKVYDRLGVSLEEHGESFYNSMIPDTIEELSEAGLVGNDDGADIVRLEHFTYPLIVRKRDGERQLV